VDRPKFYDGRDILFSHAEVTGIGTGTASAVNRRLIGGLCQKGREEIVGNPGGCRPGGNGCWEREVRASTLEVTVSPPLQLPEAADHLDMAWRLLFGHDRRLFRSGGIGDIAALMLPCPTREEFESRLSDLADLLGRIRVPDELLQKKDRGIPGNETMNRLRAALLDRLDEASADELERAIELLRATARVRVGQQHSAADQRTLESFEVLGIRYPVDDWDAAWSRIRSTAAEAFLRLAHLVRRLLTD